MAECASCASLSRSTAEPLTTRPFPPVGFAPRSARWLDSELQDHILAIERKLDDLAQKVEGAIGSPTPLPVPMPMPTIALGGPFSKHAVAPVVPVAPAAPTAVPPEFTKKSPRQRLRGPVPFPLGDAAIAEEVPEDSIAPTPQHQSEVPGSDTLSPASPLQMPPRMPTSPLATASVQLRVGRMGSERRRASDVSWESGYSTVRAMELSREGLPFPSSWANNIMKSTNSINSAKGRLAGLNPHRLSSHGRPLSVRAERIHIFLEDRDSSREALWYSRLMPLLVLASVFVSLVQMTEQTLMSALCAAAIETTFDSLFALETLLRLCVSPAPLLFFLSPFNMIDLVAALALALRASVGFVLDASVGAYAFPRVALLCFLPVVRLLKLLRRWEKVHLLTKAFIDVFEAMPILLFPLLVLTLLFATLIFIVEPAENIGSLGKAAWLTIVTMTTVGYGDVTPESPEGSLIVGMLVISSVLYMAMPIGIIGYAFTSVWQDRDRVLLLYRTRNRLTSWGYTAHDVNEIFHVFDSNRNGVLTIHEFKTMIRKLKLGLPDKRIRDLFKIFDEDNSGSIDDREFVKTLFPEKFLEVYGPEPLPDAARSQTFEEFPSTPGAMQRGAL